MGREGRVDAGKQVKGRGEEERGGCEESQGRGGGRQGKGRRVGKAEKGEKAGRGRQGVGDWERQGGDWGRREVGVRGSSPYRRTFYGIVFSNSEY